MDIWLNYVMILFLFCLIYEGGPMKLKTDKVIERILKENLHNIFLSILKWTDIVLK